jgi:hypothetical protein
MLHLGRRSAQNTWRSSRSDTKGIGTIGRVTCDGCCKEPGGRRDTATVILATHDIHGRASRKSSIFLRRIVGVVFMRVNSKCAHQVRPPLSQIKGLGAQQLASTARL